MALRYHMVMVVWGEVFSDFYTRITIPTQLAEHSLPALAARAEVSYHIHATKRAESLIRDAPLYRELSKTVAVTFHRIDEAATRGENKYALLTTCHRRSIAIARERDEALVFLCPDGLFSDGAFPRLHELARDGVRAVMVAGLRAHKPGLVGDLAAEDALAGERPIALAPRRLVGLLARNLHPVEQALCWREEELSSWPSHLLWRVGDAGLLARCFHLHPLMIRPERWHWRGGARDTIDSHFVTQAVSDPSQIHLVTDSDEIAVCEVSDDIRGAVHQPTRNVDCGAARVAAWMRRSTDALQRSFVQHPFRLHAREIARDETRWLDAATRSDDVIARIEATYAQISAPTASPESIAAGSPAS